MIVSIAGQISEVEREISMRREVFPRQVQRRMMKESEAELKIAYMEAVLRTLRWLQQNEAAIKQRLAVTDHE